MASEHNINPPPSPQHGSFAGAAEDSSLGLTLEENKSTVSSMEHEADVNVVGAYIEGYDVAYKAESYHAYIGRPAIVSSVQPMCCSNSGVQISGSPGDQLCPSQNSCNELSLLHNHLLKYCKAKKRMNQNLPCTSVVEKEARGNQIQMTKTESEYYVSLQSVQSEVINVCSSTQTFVEISQRHGESEQGLEHTGESEKEARCNQIQMRRTELEDNVSYHSVLAEQIVKGDHVNHGIGSTDGQAIDDGENTQDKFSKYSQAKRVFYSQIIDLLYTDASMESVDPEVEKCNEKCIDCCCKALSCGQAAKRCFASSNHQDKKISSAVKKIVYMTPTLRWGRSKGWVIHTNSIFPLVKNTFRNVWVASTILLVFTALCLSIASFILGNHSAFNIIHLVLTLVGSILAIIDCTILLCQCSWKCGRSDCCQDSGGNKDDSPQDSGRNKDDSPDSEGNKDDLSRGRPLVNAKCKYCTQKCKSIFDISRMILAEILFYPLLICDIIGIITGESYKFNNAKDGISFVLFVISLALVLFCVYIIRLFIVIVAIYNSQKMRRLQPGDDTPESYDPTIRKSALFFQIYFAIHVFGQMVAQILMIITIGMGIYEENKNSVDGNVIISGWLWYMIVAGYVLPVFGILSFFIVTYFWVQEFPIGICVDFLSILQRPGIDEMVNVGKTREDGGEIMNRTIRQIYFSELKRQFNDLCNTPFRKKFSYPFISPQMVVLSLMYALLHLFFLIGAIIVLDNNWPISFYFTASIIGYLANIYVFTVAAFWSVVIVVILLIIIVAIVLYILYCFLACCCGCSINNNNNNYNYN